MAENTYRFIRQITLTTSTLSGIDINDIPIVDYNDLLIRTSLRSSVFTGSVSVGINFNSNIGNVYSSTGFAASGTSTLTATNNNNGTTISNGIVVYGTSNSSTTNTDYYVSNYTSSTLKTGWFNSASAALNSNCGFFYVNITAPITSCRISAGGNLLSGSFVQIYGIKRT